MILDRIRLEGLTTIDMPIIFALPTNKYIVKAADGLGPVEVDVYIANTLAQGGQYQGRRPQSREIVLRVGLNPDYGSGQNASDLRNELYGLLSPNVTDNILVQLMSNALTVDMQTEGYVKRIEIVPFSKDPEVQIVIACPEPYFEAPVTSNWVPSVKNNFIVPNLGTAPTGFILEATFTSARAGWTLRHGDPADGPPYLYTSYTFATGDTILYWTQPGERYLYVRKANGTEINIIDTMSDASSWLMLHGGDNLFTTSHTNFNWGFINRRARFQGV